MSKRSVEGREDTPGKDREVCQGVDRYGEVCWGIRIGDQFAPFGPWSEQKVREIHEAYPTDEWSTLPFVAPSEPEATS